jgi:cyanophycinase
MHPECFGLGIDEGTAVVVRGRRIEVLGSSTATVILAASESSGGLRGTGRPLKEIELKAGDVHDLTMLRRAAVERSLASFPPAEPPPPKVESGSLVIVGGGGMPREVTEKFIELAGGPESLIVVLPTAAGDTIADTAGETRFFERAGAKNVKALTARKRAEVESPEFAAAMQEAKGVWFGGGRQWRFVDAYAGTKAEELLQGVLRRGGVIGGSSAGASIQAQYMVRGSPLGNTDMMAEGYERGLGFLPGAAVDQHFSQRKRQPDMTRVMQRYPQILGIGIDEATALIVRGQVGEVMGRSNVQFYDYKSGPPAAEPDYAQVKPGGKYDLVERKVLE